MVTTALAGALAGCHRRPSGPSAPEDETPTAAIDANAAETPEALRARLMPGPAAPALFVIAGLHGYTEPCGCTEDLLQGGIDRLIGTLKALANASPHAATIASGDFLFRTADAEPLEEAQDLARVQVIFQAMKSAGVDAIGVGPRDLARGVPLLVESAQLAGIPLVSTNLRAQDGPIGSPWRTVDLNGLTIAVLSAVSRDALSELPTSDELVFEDPAVALQDALANDDLQRADLRVLFFHGSIDDAAGLSRALPTIDIFIPAETTEATTSLPRWSNTYVPQILSQGRELGVFRFSSPEGASGPWENAAPFSTDDRTRLEELVQNVDAQIARIRERLDPADEEPALLLRLRERRARYEEELQRAQNTGTPAFHGEHRELLWDVIPLAPGLPEDHELHAARERYNHTLAELNLANATPPPPAVDGAPSFVGASTCQSCHSGAHTQWESTPHARAWETLEARNKHFDLECVGCHVTGYQQPGGSALGFTTSLENVQCETCHGAGSLHAAAPTETNIQKEVTPGTCTGCHNSEHSPNFDFDAYLPRILGPNHGETRLGIITGLPLQR